ncbi:MAG: anhydro-N-acetylmuramic acid kinase [Legionellales bacterium]
MALYIGLMSGTSMDGIDAALVDLPSNRLVCGIVKKYSEAVTQGITNILNASSLSLPLICQLNTLIGRDFAAAVLELLQEAQVSAQDVVAIGSHGQTLCHDASASIPYTLQLGCAHTIASVTHISVVADFRTRDLVNGGQGAPFAPLYHQELFAKKYKNTVVVNIGGISNSTFIVANEPTRGWDVGPGNCLMDAWTQKHLGKPFDTEGAWAKQGIVLEDLLAKWLLDPFLALVPPKSIGKEYYSQSWLESFLEPQYRPVDVQATLLAFTCHCIARSVHDTKILDLDSLFLCGGGAHNIHLCDTLSDLLPNVAVKSTACIGVNPDYLEAMMFAWLASQTISNNPVNLSSITGSRGDELLGAIYPC